MNTNKKIAGVLITVLCAACATGGAGTRPDRIPMLEQTVAAQPGNADAATSLGVAYFNAKRYEDARNTLARVTASGSANAEAYLYLGLANEELKDYAAARAAYEKFVEVGKDGRGKDQIRMRLAFVAREQLKQEAKQVLAREQQMSEEPPTPRTLAVMPFRLVGVSDELSPLQTALSDMIITDLSVSPAITSIERVKINSIIDEMLLAQAGLAEEKTGARVGRLLKAEHVVQGVLAQSGDKQLRMDATVLNTARQEAAGNFGQSEAVDAIFDLEKQIVFNIFNTVGVTLTDAEREKINENRTANLLAFLAYGRGLEALDKGNYQQATTYFRQASRLDPSFQRVQAQQQEAVALQTAVAEPPAEVVKEVVTPSAPVAAEPSLAQALTNEVNNNPATQMTAPPAPQTPPATTQGTNTAQNTQTPSNAQGNSGGVNNATKAKITITICRPGTSC